MVSTGRGGTLNLDNYSKLTVKQLNNVLEKIKAELKRREDTAKVVEEINVILGRSNVSFSDLKEALKTGPATAKKAVGKPRSTQKRSAKPPSKSRKKQSDGRTKVKPLYFEPNGEGSWSGRGKAPAWVRDICSAKKISTVDFKKDSMFQQPPKK